ncbi:GntR family transcriptional regulator [Bacillus sp. TL12]|nr:GntR family transcriptional regulator [Bacillus sp. TL12]MCI0768426.1 GntR family transcriptional regulator [Bacillus sp. TL12]
MIVGNLRTSIIVIVGSVRKISVIVNVSLFVVVVENIGKIFNKLHLQ